MLRDKATNWLQGGMQGSALANVGSERYSLELQDGAQQYSLLQCLALKALTIQMFKFEEITILPVVRAAVIKFLDHPLVEIRRSAARSLL